MKRQKHHIFQSLMLAAVCGLIAAQHIHAQEPAKTELNFVGAVYTQKKYHYYTGKEHIPQWDDFEIRQGADNIFTNQHYRFEIVPGQDNTVNVTDANTHIKMYIIAQEGYTFTNSGDTIGDYRNAKGQQDDSEKPLLMPIYPRVLDYTRENWTVYDKTYDGATAVRVTFAPKGNEDGDNMYASMGGFVTADKDYIKIDTVYAHFTDNDKNCLNENLRPVTITGLSVRLTEAGIAAGKEYLLNQYTISRNPTDLGNSLFHYPGDKNDAGSQYYPASGQELYAHILRIPLSVTGWDIASKIYDGTTDPPAVAVVNDGLDGIILNEDVTPGAVTATCNTPNAGPAILTISGLALAGADTANYSISATHTADFTILKRKITGDWRVYDKPWDGRDTAYVWFDILPNDVIVGTEQVAVSVGGHFDDAAIGNGKPVTVTAGDIKFVGLPAVTANYELPDPPAPLPAAITCLDAALTAGTYQWFYYTGAPQPWTAPAAGYYFCEAWGARGGTSPTYGGYSSGWRWLNAGQTIYIYAGQSGRYQPATAWNGGGAAGNDGSGNYGGGGGTDFRIESPGTINGISFSDSRFLVAGGSGGYENGAAPGSGGGWFGGSLTAGTVTSYGGTQTTGYLPGTGQSGSGDMMGSGGGWWGGYATYIYNSGGAGGSGYIGGVADGVTTSNVNPFDGYARISQLFEAKKLSGSYIYDGSPIEPTASEIEIKFFNDRTLSSSDFEIVPGSYADNTDAGIFIASFKFRLTTLPPGFCDLNTVYTARFIIEQREISVAAFDIDKVYDASRHIYPRVKFANIIDKDTLDVRLNINTIYYNDKQAGENKPITLTWYTRNSPFDRTPAFAGTVTYLIGDKADNYKLDTGTTAPAAPAVRTIYKRVLTADFLITKPYDGTGTAYVTYTNLNLPLSDKGSIWYGNQTDGLIMEVVRFKFDAQYDNASVGTGKPVTATASLNTDNIANGGSTVSQADFNNNYDISELTMGLTGEIRPFNLCTDARPLDAFRYTGDLQPFDVQAGYNYRFEVWGAQGGSTAWNNIRANCIGTGCSGPEVGNPNGYQGNTQFGFDLHDPNGVIGGKGGYSRGDFLAPAARQLQVYVGGTGAQGGYGYNGGGRAGTVTNDGTYFGGGGATDISLDTHLTSDTITGYDPRIIVAGGGGGESAYSEHASNGGYGGGPAGGDGGKGGTGNHANLAVAGGATQTGGGEGSRWQTSSSGTPGGHGAKGLGGSQLSEYGGGGGGGWYGGGAGSWVSGVVSSGAGGSGYAGPLNGLKYGVTEGGNTAAPSPIAGNDAAHAMGRHGYARIGLLPVVHFKGESGADTTFYYHADEKIPHHIVITIGADTLKPGTDYNEGTITYDNNIQAGDSARCIITVNKANYIGCGDEDDQWIYYYPIKPFPLKCTLTPDTIPDNCYLPDGTICAECGNKLYDGNGNAKVYATVLNADDIPDADREAMVEEVKNITVNAYFSRNIYLGPEINAGDSIPIIITGINIGSYTGSNYSLDTSILDTLKLTGKICRRPLQYELTGQNKIYDGTPTAPVTIKTTVTNDSTGVVGVPPDGDVANPAHWWARFVENDSITSRKNVDLDGLEIKIRVDSLTLEGKDSHNYYFDTLRSTVSAAHINPLCLTEAIRKDFAYTGAPQTFVAPWAGWYKLEAWGASGGRYVNQFGPGGYVSGTTYLETGDTLYIHVGQAGGGYTATYNGGGSSGTTGSSGGGATDFRTASGAWNVVANLTSRLLVAGGGGGQDDGSGAGNDGLGGAAGGLSGYYGMYYTTERAQPGTQTSGNANGTGGNGVSDGGGGGGGYYGGAGGGNNDGGGGGSSYISSAACIGPTMIDGQGFVWNLDKANYSLGSVTANRAGVTEPNGAQSTWGHAGDGFARVTALPSVDSVYTYTATHQMVEIEGIILRTFIDSLLTENTGVDFYDCYNCYDYGTAPGNHSDNFHARLFVDSLPPRVMVTGVGNYTCDLDIPFTINRYPIDIATNAWCREYDGTDTVHIAAEYKLPDNATDSIQNDVDNIGKAVFTARFTEDGGRNVGVNKTLEVLNFTFTDGIHAHNYIVDDSSLKNANLLTATVYPRLLKGEWVAVDKMYDNTDTAYVSVRAGSHNLLDPVTVGFIAHYSGNGSTEEDNINADEANRKKIVVDSLVFSGAAAANYTWRKFEIADAVGNYCPTTDDWTAFPSGLPNMLKASINRFCLYDYFLPIQDNVLDFEGFFKKDNPVTDFTAKQEAQEFVAPHTGYYRLEAWGAQGGRYAGNKGGMGAYTAGNVFLTKGEKIYVYVGLSNTVETKNMHPYWNGGGGTHSNTTAYDYGGGATDFRLLPGPNATAWNDAKSLKSRFMVAAGGGARGNNSLPATTPPNQSIAAGGLYNYLNRTGQTYVAYTTGSPGFGQGAWGLSGASYAGAGGGWWGGTAISTGEGAIGGTSYISGHLGCVAITDVAYTNNPVMGASTTDNNSQFKGNMTQAAGDVTLSYSPTGKILYGTLMIDGIGRQWTTVPGTQVNMLKPDGSEMETGHGGDGYARITALGILTGKMDIDPGFDKLSGSNVTTDARTKKANFDYTGTVQTFVAPHTGTYQMEVWGAQGGAGNGRDTQGEGGYSRGTTFLNEGDTLHIYVGGRGASDTNPTNNASNAGGFNGGGSGSSSGGGGATDIRMYNGGTPAPASNPTQGLTGIPSTDPRIIVAGGGGGGQRWNGSATGNGDDGDGGGESGVQSGSVYINPPTDLTQAQPGTQTAGGAGTVPSTGGGAGGVGVAGKGGLSQNSNVGGGGGGGGWFGGGGGGWANNQVSGGAGGSGYISPTLTDAFTQSGSFVFLSPAGTYEAGHAGHGYARISYGHTLVFRAKAYVPDDFTGLVVDHITAFGDTLHLVGTDKIGLSCIDSRNASDTARLHIEGKAGSNYACFMDFPFTISKRQLKGTWFALDRLYDGTDSVHVAFTSVAVDIDTDPSNDPEGCVYGTLAPADTTGYLIHYTYTGNDAETELTVTSYGLFNHLKDVPYNQLIFPERAKDVLKPRADMLKTAKDSLLYPLGQYGYHRKLVYAKTILTGPDAGNYLPPPAPLCNWDSLKANPLTYADTLKSRLTPIDLKGNWTAQNKVYDGTTLANFGYFPDMSLAIPGDDLNFTLDAARFKSKHAGINIVLARGMFKGYGMDVDNYSGVGDVPTENDFNSTSFRATIYPRPLFHLPEDTLAAAGVWTAYNKLYDALDTCRITYAMDSTILMKEGTTIRFPLGYSDGKTQYNTETIEKDDDVRIEIRNGKFQTFGDAFPLRGKDVGVNKAVTLTSLTGITDPKTGKLKPNPGTVTYFTRTLKDIQQNDSIVVDSLKMHIPYPSSPADSLEIALLGTDARNYTFFDYQYNFESVYDTITIASGKTVVENIITTVTDSTLIIPDTLRADITAWQLTGDWYVPDKIYDGSAKVAGEHFAPGDTLKFTPDVVAPLPGDPQPAPLAGDVVYIAGDAPPGDDWEAHFARRDVQRNPDDYAWIDSMQVFIAPLKYSGPDARNYLLPPPDTLYAKIHPRQLDGKYEADDREYDATDSVHVELQKDNIVTPEGEAVKDTVNIRIWAHFEDLPRDGTLRMTIPGYWYAIVDSVKISGADAYNYDPPVYTPLDSLDAHAFEADTVKAHIRYAVLEGEWKARDRVYEEDSTYAEVVFTPTNKKPGTDIEVSITGATFSDQWTATEKPISVKEEDISITGADSLYYEVDAALPGGFSATIYPNTFHIAGSWSEYHKWLGYNSDTGANHGENQTTMLPPDSTHVHIRANLIQDMNVLHRDSITVYDVQFTVGSDRTLKAMMFTLKDNATFMNSGGNISGIDTARVVRTLPAGRNWYVSSPMDNTAIPQVAGEVLLHNAAGLPVSGKGRVEWYSDADYYWHPYHESDGVTAGFENPSEYNYGLVNGLGYTAYSATEDIVTSFKGKFNDGDRPSPALSRTEGRIKSGYTLVGNPFPSYWQWTGGEVQTGSLPTIWYRTRTAVGYRFWTYNASSGKQTAPGVDTVKYSLSWVPPMQAFWVRLPKGAGNIPSDYRHFTFHNSQRAHDTSADNGPNLLKSASLRSGAQPVREEVLLRVEVLDDGNPSDEAVIYADAAALSGYDRYDSDKMFNGSGGELYTFPRAANNAATTAATTADDDAFLVINGLPRIQSGDTVPVGFTSDAAGNFALRTKESAGMDSLAVDLYDRLTGDVVEDFDLGGEYVFESEIAPVTGSATETRFLLVFRERVTADSPSGEASAIRLWVDRQNRLHVWNAAGEDLLLFNMQGALVGRWRIATSRETIETALMPGVYVARAGSVTAKVIFYR